MVFTLLNSLWLFLVTIILMGIHPSHSFTPATAPFFGGGLFSEPQWRAPTFTQEPPNRIDFLNELGAALVCKAEGHPTPQVHWQGSDNKIVSNIDNFRTVLSNSTLLIHPFKPASYRQDVHSTTYRCVASNAVGAIRSRDIQVRAVITQPWSVKVGVYPTRLSPGVGPVLLKCEVDLMGGGRDFIEVTGWKRDGKFIPDLQSNPYSRGSGEDEDNRFQFLPNGDLIIESVEREDSGSKVVCITRHKITEQETVSSAFTIVFSDKPSHARSGDESNIAESFPAPIVVREGDPIVLHCYEPPSSSPFSPSKAVRWEKLSESSWHEMPRGPLSQFFRQIGSSLVTKKSSISHSGHYRCSRQGSQEKVREVEVRVTQPLSVKVTINQLKSPLDSTAELACKIVSSSHTSASVIWLKDANLINPGGRVRFFSTNVLQINQIQQDDQGMYQCVVRTEMESAQDSVRLELADVQPRLIYGFIEQTLAPGPSVSFRCGFSGWPTPSITWWLDNWPITLTYDSRILIGNVTSHGHLISYLNISETRVEDGGLYTCKATNRAGTITHSARLNIYGPPWIRVVPPVVAISGEFFMLNCPISGWPISFGGILWEKDGQRLPLNQRQRVASNGTLAITLVDKSDSGGYWCAVSDSQGRLVRREIQVNVVAPLRISPFPESSRVVEGERSTLVCTLSSGDPPVRISWTMIPSAWPKSPMAVMNQEDGTSSTSLGSGVSSTSSAATALFTVVNTDSFTSLLSIGRVSEAHAGKYICNASSTAGSTFRSHDLTVLVPPKIEPFTFQEGLSEKMMTRLVCGVSQGDLPIEFSWFKDGKGLSKDDPWTNNIEISTLDPFSTLLRFSSLSSFHAGLYTCQASNPASRIHFSAKLLVQVAPRWIEEPQDINITRGRETQFNCRGFGIPDPKVSWLKATGDAGDPKWRPVDTVWPSMAAQAISIGNGSLMFSMVEESHEGQYMCSINNGIGSGLSKTVQLHVHVQPYFLGGESQPISLTQGKTHEITCEAVSSSPIYLTWAKGPNVFVNVPANRIHTVVVMDGRKTKSTLVMKDIRSDDSGLYQCSASNALGKVTRAYRLVVEEQPGAPGRVRLTEETRRAGPEATKVSLEWDPPREYSSNPSQFSGEEPPQETTTVFPPILLYVVEFSLQSEEKSRFSGKVEIPGDRTSAKVDNLSPASVYLFRVRAINSAGSGPPSDTLLVRTANIPPSVSPSNGRAVAVSSRAILLSWSPVPIEMTFGKVLAYRILIGTNSEMNDLLSGGKKSDGILLPIAVAHRDPHNTSVLEGTLTFAEQNCCQTLIHGLSPFTHYEIKVAALNIAGSGPFSPTFTVKTAEEAPLLPPRNPLCLPLTSQSIQISWQHPVQSNGPITSYKVVFYPLTTNSFLPQGNQRFGEIHRTSGLTSVIGGLQPNTNYSFHVTPINIAGEGSQSLNVFCKTSEDVPSPPSNLIGYPNTDSSVFLSWLHPAKPNGILTHHTVYFRMIDKSSDSYEIKRTVPANVDFFEENGLELSRFKYIFWVTSSNRMGESQPSAQLLFGPPTLVETRLVGQSRRIEVHQGAPTSLPCKVVGLEGSSSQGSGNGESRPISESSAVSWAFNGKRVALDGNVYMKPGHSDLIFFGVRKSDQGNYTCHLRNGNKNNNNNNGKGKSSASKTSGKKVISGMDLSPTSQQQLTYRLHVKGLPCVPQPAYRVEDRDILISWTVESRSPVCDPPLGLILYYRALGSILDWKKVIFQPSLRNYTLKEVTCGSILNMYMVAFNEVGTSDDSHLMSVVVSHQVSPLLSTHELIVPNISSILLNLYPINSNRSFCPAEKFSLAVREWKSSSSSSSSEWLPGKDVKIQFRNEYSIDGLKPSSPYEIILTVFGYSTSRSGSYTVTTLTSQGETPSTDVLNKNMVTSEYSPLYSNLTLILPSVIASVAVLAALVAVVAYCKTRRRGLGGGSSSGVGGPLVAERECTSKQSSDVNYGYLQQRKSLPHEDQFYSGLPCPPHTPGMEDISPYATFQISDPKKFHEESFSQEIVVAKFHPVMHGVPRGSRDKWIDRDLRQMPDSEDSESEATQRYAVIPSQRPRLNNRYQMNQPHPQSAPQPLPFHPTSTFLHHHHQQQHQLHQQQQQHPESSDCEDDCDDSSSSDPSRTIDSRRTVHKDREGRRGRQSSRDYARNHGIPNETGGSSTSNLCHTNKRKSSHSDYSIAV